jgi:hypothetical protein
MFTMTVRLSALVSANVMEARPLAVDSVVAVKKLVAELIVLKVTEVGCTRVP